MTTRIFNLAVLLACLVLLVAVYDFTGRLTGGW